MSHPYLGKRMVSSYEPPERRKSEAELRRMSCEDRLIYQRNAAPLTDEEKTEALRREDDDASYQAAGDVSHQDLLDNHPPSDWGA